MKSKGYFVTGSDTNIGKTVVATGLSLGLNYAYWKPIQTGSMDGTDRDFVAEWLGSHTYPESYLFPEPASPQRAASLAGQKIDLRKIEKDFLSLPDELIVEGAGGVLVPINADALIVDLISVFALPTIVVTSTKLGTINHTLLTLESLIARSIIVAGFISVGDEAPETVRTIEYFSGSRSLGHIPICKSFSFEWFIETFQQLDIPQI